jgi:hypothetical protein
MEAKENLQNGGLTLFSKQAGRGDEQNEFKLK